MLALSPETGRPCQPALAMYLSEVQSNKCKRAKQFVMG